MSVVLLSVLALVACTQAQVPSFGACPDLPVKTNFNAKKYTGIWYEYERYFAIFELFGTCTYANYTLKPNGRIDVVNTGVNRFTGNANRVHGEAYAPDASEPAKLLVSFDQSPAKPGPYWVLDTDYRNYSIVYSCVDLVDTSWIKAKAEIVWILARSRAGPSASLVQKAEGKLKNLGVSTIPLLKTRQTNCSN
ncbi:apolipoprotein D-like [Lineus longissimus]|uniref:apolipoprotein D-like n=1 Tax=Lineus longissimus TaxID=88925 RepID=UPI002B4EBB25